MGWRGGSHQSVDVFRLVDERSDLLGVSIEDSLDERRLGGGGEE